MPPQFSLDYWVFESRKKAPQRLAKIWAEGAQPVYDWFGASYLNEILPRYMHIVQASVNYYIINAPPSAVSDFAAGWNAASLADGTLLFNHRLLTFSWAVAQAYARHKADPNFPFPAHLRKLAERSVEGDLTLPPSADPLNKLVPTTAYWFRDMLAFTAAHEVVHYVRHHEAKMAQLLSEQPDDAQVQKTYWDHEFEADRKGIDYLVNSWAFDGRGALLTLVFMHLQDEYAGREGSFTHPPSSERYRRVHQWLEDSGFQKHL